MKSPPNISARSRHILMHASDGVLVSSRNHNKNTSELRKKNCKQMAKRRVKAVRVTSAPIVKM